MVRDFYVGNLRFEMYCYESSAVYEVRERFAERAKRRDLHPAHKDTVMDISKDFLKELIRGLPKR